MERYTNKELAQEKADDLNSTSVDKICPLMNGRPCKKKCICWMNAEVRTHTDDKGHGLKDVCYSIVGHTCSNAMFTIERVCNNQY